MEKEILQEVTSYDLSDSELSFIRRILKNPYLADISDFWECIYIITNAFQENRCQDINVISKVLKLACYRSYCEKYAGRRFPRSIPFFKDFMKAADNMFPATLFVPAGYIYSSNNVDFVLTSVATGEVKCLKLLLNFGANILFPPDTAFRSFAKSLVILLRRCYNPLYAKELENSMHVKCEEMNRLYLVSTKLHILIEILGKPDIGENVVRATRLLFKSLPFEYITSKEVRMVLERFLRDPSKTRIEQIIKDYEHYFPESTDPWQTRSLQDLCRCRVRESLRVAKTIYYGVPLLPLPKYLKNFVLFETEIY